MLGMALPVLHAYPGATWMTLGDGNFGTDAHFLGRHGAQVVATSITDETLKVARELGYVHAIRAENAEAISLPDNAFEFVFCKEAYHHFPRPALAFYEMLRVARRAVVLIEPADSPARPLDWLRIAFKKAFRRDVSLEFEPSGNFIFRLNRRETEKMLSALGFPCLAWKPFNDFYHPFAARGEYSELSPRTWLLRLGLAAQDALCALRLMRPGLACMVAFKEAPSENVRTALRTAGFRIAVMPVNPYVVGTKE